MEHAIPFLRYHLFTVYVSVIREGTGNKRLIIYSGMCILEV